ncbi:GntR family transcriptional regulator [uncultured Tateyamaria sp.]|uniref:GntR family transcriptional regulator n=1 Tax=uncultured Tateyamaria sp. TaxID=455651 RepID=UPI0026188148|nr:GntR family transcriptional regulator [uncultured Tateyamaria sp.]
MNHATSEMNDTVSAIYVKLREMAASFAFKPGERVNESSLSRDLGASRTPLREALNRLVAEGFVEFSAGRGFFCRTLSDKRIIHLYQARMAIECEAVRQAAMHAKPAELEAIDASLDLSADEYSNCTNPIRLMELDEAFHLQLAGLSGNPELLRMLETIYDKIRFVRTADLRRLQAAGRTTTERHRAVLDIVRTGDGAAASAAMRDHIEHRAKHASEAVRLAFADLYAPQEELT